MKNQTEKLGRAADKAVWAVEVAESIRELVGVVLENKNHASAEVLGRMVDRALAELVTTYQRRERAAVDAFVESIQAGLRGEVRR